MGCNPAEALEDTTVTLTHLPLYRCTGSVATYGQGGRVLSIGCRCVFHPLEVDANRLAPCKKHSVDMWAPAQLSDVETLLHYVRPEDIARWQLVVRDRVQEMDPAKIVANFGDGIPDPTDYPQTTPAGAAHLALSLVLGEQAREFLWSVVAPRLSELSELEVAA
jgi:hypothetical protein